MITEDPGQYGRYAGWLEILPLVRQARDDDIESLKAFLEGRIEEQPLRWSRSLYHRKHTPFPSTRSALLGYDRDHRQPCYRISPATSPTRHS
jgi:hypothetical protein